MTLFFTAMALLPQVSSVVVWWWWIAEQRTEKTLSTARTCESLLGPHTRVPGESGGDGVGGGVCGRRGGGVGGHWVRVRRVAGGARAAVSGAACGGTGVEGAGSSVCRGPDCCVAGGRAREIWQHRRVTDQCDAFSAEYLCKTFSFGAVFSVSGPSFQGPQTQGPHYLTHPPRRVCLRPAHRRHRLHHHRRRGPPSLDAHPSLPVSSL